MLKTLTNNAFVHWVSSQFSVECDLIHTHESHEYHDLPGKADFAYVISPIGICFIDKRQNISREFNLNDERITELKHRLKINSEVNENVCLIEEGISSDKLRAIHHYTRFHTPKTLMPIINTTLVLSLFGFIPYAWMFYLPIFLAYNIYHYKTTGVSVIRFTTNLVTFFRNFSRRFGEWFGETLTLHPNRIVKIVASSAILLFLGLNSWSLIAIYGIYRFKDNEWLNFFNKGISAIYNFCTGVFIKSLGKTSFYKRLGIGFGLAMLLATQSYVGGVFSLIMMGVLVVNSIAIGIGFKAIFRDLYYALRNPIKVAFKNTGKVIGALWGRYIAYRLLTGHVEGTLGPAIGHVESHGIFSGLFSSFLSPGGWFTTQSGWFGLLAVRVQNFLNTVMTSVFVTTEMQTQGNFYGIVGPTLLQLFVFMSLGCLVGYLVERSVNRFSHQLKDEVVHQGSHKMVHAKTIYQNAYEQGYVSKWHIGYFMVLTPLILASEGGAAIISLTGGSILGASLLTATGVIGALMGVKLAALGLKKAYLKLTGFTSNALEPAISVTTEAAVNLSEPSPTLLLGFENHLLEKDAAIAQTPMALQSKLTQRI